MTAASLVGGGCLPVHGGLSSGRGTGTTQGEGRQARGKVGTGKSRMSKSRTRNTVGGKLNILKCYVHWACMCACFIRIDTILNI